MTLSPQPALAPDPYTAYLNRLRDSSYRPLPEPELTVRVKTARIAALDPVSLKAAFPEACRTRAACENFYHAHVPYLALHQLQAPMGIQSPSLAIDLGDTLAATRPPDYGRALILPAGFDAKGHGALVPSGERNGLISLRMAFKEYLLQHIEEIILSTAAQEYPELRLSLGPGTQTVPSFGVLDWGFDQYDQRTKRWIASGSPTRWPYLRGVVSAYAGDRLFKRAVFIENTLRLYGLSAAIGSAAGAAPSWMNIQLSEHGQLIDFGHHRAIGARFEGGFRAGISSPEVSAQLEWGALSSVLTPLFERAKRVADPLSPIDDPVLALGHDWASRFRSRELSAQAVEAEIQGLLQEIGRLVLATRGQLAGLRTDFCWDPNLLRLPMEQFLSGGLSLCGHSHPGANWLGRIGTGLGSRTKLSCATVILKTGDKK